MQLQFTEWVINYTFICRNNGLTFICGILILICIAVKEN